MDWQVFFSPFSSLKMFPHCLLASIVSEEKSSYHLYCCYSVYNGLSWPETAFKIFLFSLAFSNLSMMCLGMVFFILVLLGIFSASCICKRTSFTKLRTLPSSFLQILFIPHCLPSLLAFQVHIVRPLALSPGHCDSNFSNTFLLLFKLYNFYWSHFKFTDSFLHYLQSSAKLIKNFFLLDIFSRSHISIYNYFPFLRWDFLFSCIMRIFSLCFWAQL